MEASLKLENISKKFGSLEIFKNFSINFLPNKINCILGPSGCGKTSLLNMISGGIPLDSGNRNDFENMSFSYVFQEPRLLPWKTVEDNIAFVLKDKMKPKEITKKVDEQLSMVQLIPFRHYYPGQLSGGMKQRVSLARAFSAPSDIILMDEPFKALDWKLKNNLMDEFRKLWEKDTRTVIFVTHEVDEAISLGHKVFVFSRPVVHLKGEYKVPGEETKRTELAESLRGDLEYED